MATALVDACAICANSFNSDFYRSVSLPCGHDFCLLCIVRLNASGKHKCPTCRSDWAGFDVPALPGMEALAAALQTEQDDEGDMPKKKGMFDRCRNHSLPYDYWVTGTTEFFCRRCAAENRQVGIEVIEDVIPQIREVLSDEVLNAGKKVESDLESLDDMHALFVKKRNSVKEFMKEVMALDDHFKHIIEHSAASRSQVLTSAANVKRMMIKIKSIQGPSDINLVAECKSTLKKAVRPLTSPSSDLPQSLLYDIACSYVAEKSTQNPPSKASFVTAVLKSGPKPSPETVHTADQLKEGQEWTVDNNNWEAALLALTDRQPSTLTLVARDDAREALPVAALAKAAKGCQVEARFIDTFFSATNTSIDAERLQHLTANKSLHLLDFYGHLDHSSIAKLPHTIYYLNLAIGSAADAAAVSGLRPWKGLRTLSVAMSSRVSAEDLKPLPSGLNKQLNIPFLSDARVNSVRPAIAAIAPDLRIDWLILPKCHLTADGARQLTRQLLGVTISSVYIEERGTWRTSAVERQSVASEFNRATGCNLVGWHVDFIYR